MEPTEAYKTLGQFDQLLTMVKQWPDRIRTSYMQKHDAANGLKETVLKKIQYALPVLNLSKGQYDKLMRPIFQAALPKAGYNRNFLKEVIHGPNGRLGVDIHHPYTTQLITHIDMLLRHGGGDTITGQLLTRPPRTIIWTELQTIWPAKYRLLGQGRMAGDPHDRNRHSGG
jgi:hypothetical protein